jgi:hypothetical protein
MSQTPGQADHAAALPPLSARIRKALISAAGLAFVLVSSGALDGTTEAVVSGILAAGTAFGVWAVPNARRP